MWSFKLVLHTCLLSLKMKFGNLVMNIIKLVYLNLKGGHTPPTGKKKWRLNFVQAVLTQWPPQVGPPWPKAWVGNHYGPARRFITQRHIHKTRMLGAVVVSHPRFWPRGPASGGHWVRMKISRHFFFLLHKARVYTSDFLTVQTYTEVQKQTMSF